MVSPSSTLKLLVLGFFLSASSHLFGAALWRSDESAKLEGSEELAVSAVGSTFEDLIQAGGELSPLETESEKSDTADPQAAPVPEPTEAKQNRQAEKLLQPKPNETPPAPSPGAVEAEVLPAPARALSPIVETNAQSDLEALIPSKSVAQTPPTQELELVEAPTIEPAATDNPVEAQAQNQPLAAIKPATLLKAKPAEPILKTATPVQIPAVQPHFQPIENVESRVEPAQTPQTTSETLPPATPPVEAVKPELKKQTLPTEFKTAAVVPTQQIQLPQKRPDYTPPPAPETVKIKPKKKTAAKPRNTRSGSAKGNANISARKGEKKSAKDARAAANNSVRGRNSQAGNASASNYQGKVRRKISRGYRKAGRAKGIAKISFRITASGRVTNIRVSRSSGNPKIDKAAAAAVKRAAPFGPPPPNINRNFAVEIGQS